MPENLTLFALNLGTECQTQTTQIISGLKNRALFLFCQENLFLVIKVFGLSSFWAQMHLVSRFSRLPNGRPRAFVSVAQAALALSNLGADKTKQSSYFQLSQTFGSSPTVAIVFPFLTTGCFSKD